MQHTEKWWVIYFIYFLGVSFFLFVQFILPVPAGSSTEPLLIKAEPIRNACSTSVIMYFGKGKNHCIAAR